MTLENQKPKELKKKNTLSNGKFIDFTINREGWNKYRVSDGSIIRGRVILTSCLMGKSLEETVKQLKPEEELKLDLVFNPRTMFSVESPPNLRGIPDTKTYSQSELNESIIEKDMDFQTMQEIWNLYKLDNGVVLKFRLTLVAVHKTNKFEAGGMPVYTLNPSIDVKIDLPTHIQKILEKKGKKNPKIKQLK